MELKTDEELNELRTKFLTNTCQTAYDIYKGCTMPVTFGNYMKIYDQFEVYEDDVWVISGPKSGTTWTQEMVWCIAHNFNLEDTDRLLETRFPYVERGCMLANVKDALVRDLQTRPRYLKSHLPWNLLPRQLSELEVKPKIVYIARNPKDVCVSFYHHHIIFNNYKGGFDLFWQLFVAGKLMYTPYINHIRAYWERRNLPHILFLKYEDMKMDLRAVIKQVAAFLEVPAKDADVEKLVKHLSFDQMRTNPATNKSDSIELMKQIGMCANPDGQFIRRGEAGGYKTEMSPEVIKYFDEWIAKELAGTGLTF